ncbi:MAG: gamma-glutamyl-gamma-aminobutyrate hydrolase family protein [Clostridia bacterium]|jgi:putative glutamine amidotransferase|nr:gamma-glutamyl-gamma-aminobutyrate hydrolase family protein [Clostridia bacterium]
MNPLIGITCGQEQEGYSVTRYYSEAIQRAGGIPVLLPVTGEQILIEAYANKLDGLLLTGGDDLDPVLFGEEPLRGLGPVDPDRDHFELELCKLLLVNGKPVLGICRGMQVLNVACGGTIYQDLVRQLPESLEHRQRAPKNRVSHQVVLDSSSLLRGVLKTSALRVNSFHHQAVKDLGQGLKAVAKASDGVIEGVEKETGFVLGVQWHPERLWQDYEEQGRLFAAFVKAALRIKKESCS